MKTFRVVVNGSEYRVAIEELADEKAARPAANPSPSPRPAAKPQAQAKPQPQKPVADHSAAAGAIIAPMPGTVLSIGVSTGEKVTRGQVLLVLEAMKMENQIMAPTDGIVEAINVTTGVSVNAGETLIVLS